MLLLRERICHGKFHGQKVIAEFSSCLETATRKCPPKRFFFGSWINTWNYVWKCRTLVIKNLFKVISWNYIPGIRINILPINQFKVLNAFRAWQTKIFSATTWKIKSQFSETKLSYLTRYRALSLFFKFLICFCFGKLIFKIIFITFFRTKLYLVQYCTHNWITKDKNKVLNYLWTNKW